MNKIGKILSADEANAQTLANHKEIEELSGSLHNFQFETMIIEKDGKMIEIEVPIDDIDLLDDFDDEDLTEEGERSLGIIDGDFDSTSGAVPDKKTRQRMTQGKVELVTRSIYNNATQQLEDVEDYVITCPYTGSTDVYKVSSNVFASYETDQHFKVVFENLDEEG
jgi:hypothetical protein